MVKIQKILRRKNRETTYLNIIPLYLRVRKCYLRSKKVILIAKLISSHFTSQFSANVMQAKNINSFKNKDKFMVGMLYQILRKIRVL